MAGRKSSEFGALLISLPVGFAACWLTWLSVRDYADYYGLLNMPSFAPGYAAFFLLWAAVYVLLSASLYFVCDSRVHPDLKSRAIKLFTGQLAVIFCWSLLLLRFQAFVLSFAMTVLLCVLTLAALSSFSRVQRVSGLLQLLCLAWFVFSACINLGVCLLN